MTLTVVRPECPWDARMDALKLQCVRFRSILHLEIADFKTQFFYFQVTIHLWKDHSEHYTPFYNRAPLSPTHWTLKKNWISCSKMVPYSFQLRWSVTYKWQGNISPVPLHETFQFLWNPMAESCTIQWVILECLWFSGNVLIIVFFDVRNICDDTCA